MISHTVKEQKYLKQKIKAKNLVHIICDKSCSEGLKVFPESHLFKFLI